MFDKNKLNERWLKNFLLKLMIIMQALIITVLFK